MWFLFVIYCIYIEAVRNCETFIASSFGLKLGALYNVLPSAVAVHLVNQIANQFKAFGFQEGKFS